MNIGIDRRDDMVKYHRLLRKLNEKRLQLEKQKTKSKSTEVMIWCYEDAIKWHKTQTAWFRDVNMPIALL